MQTVISVADEFRTLPTPFHDADLTKERRMPKITPHLWFG
jgi:hypothetical protein